LKIKKGIQSNNLNEKKKQIKMNWKKKGNNNYIEVELWLLLKLTYSFIKLKISIDEIFVLDATKDTTGDKNVI